jgi:glycine/D-amino acid oxidase-like deaminating enzyme
LTLVVIGAGVFGAWSAWFLAARGHQVTLVDAFGPANARASSADHSRVIRCGYGADEIYSRWAHAAVDDWNWLSRESGRALVETAGALFMGPPGTAYIDDTYQTLTTLGIACELMTPSALCKHYPQVACNGLGSTLFERDAGAIRARAALQLLVKLLTQRTGAGYEVARVLPLDESRDAPVFTTTSGDTLAADAYVCACGPWLSSMFPSAVGDRIRATRQEILNFGVPPGNSRFSLHELPIWIDFDAGLYGIPDFDARGFKVGVDRHGPPIDPDTADRLVDPRVVDDTRAWLARRFPALAGAPLVDSHVCQYENTHNGDFIIDRHPSWPNVWIVGGGSGHGFKHGPAVGRHVAALVDDNAAVDPRFSLTRKLTTAARTVY